jgi:hypothetical protein
MKHEYHEGPKGGDNLEKPARAVFKTLTAFSVGSTAQAIAAGRRRPLPSLSRSPTSADPLTSARLPLDSLTFTA